jgi:thiamine biosynthesis protein ThiS
MKKKIKIKINGKIKIVDCGSNIYDLVHNLNIPIKKVAIELNKEILDKDKIKKTKFKNNDIIEIVHFIGGG